MEKEKLLFSLRQFYAVLYNEQDGRLWSEWEIFKTFLDNPKEMNYQLGFKMDNYEIEIKVTKKGLY
jgi:hypothetical protein